MQFDLIIPAPTTMRVGKHAYFSLKSGTKLHRLHPDAFGSDQFNDTDKGDARFSPIRDSTGKVIPTIYGAESFECAVCEIILRCPDVPPTNPKTGLPTLQIVYPSDFSAYKHSLVQTAVDLKLVDVTIVGQRKIGIDKNALLAGPKSTYPATRAWAEKIYAECLDAQGLYYTSFQYGPAYAVVLFGDRISTGAIGPMTSRPVKDAPCHGEIGTLAQSLSIEYVDI